MRLFYFSKWWTLHITCCKQQQIREVKQRRRQRQRKRPAWKYNFISFVLLRDYFNSINFYKSGELSRNQIGRSGVQGKKENEKVTAVRSRSPQNRECGVFTLLFCRGRQRNLPKCKMHVQSDCLCSLNLLFCGVVVAVAVTSPGDQVRSCELLIFMKKSSHRDQNLVPATCPTKSNMV